MTFATAENTNTTLPKNSLCLGQIKIHISSVSNNRQPFLHRYNKELIVLAKK